MKYEFQGVFLTNHGFVNTDCIRRRNWGISCRKKNGGSRSALGSDRRNYSRLGCILQSQDDIRIFAEGLYMNQLGSKKTENYKKRFR